MLSYPIVDGKFFDTTLSAFGARPAVSTDRTVSVRRDMDAYCFWQPGAVNHSFRVFLSLLFLGQNYKSIFTSGFKPTCRGSENETSGWWTVLG